MNYLLKDLVRKPLLVFFLLSIVGLIIYAQTFTNEFCSDDLKIIVGNNAVKDIVNIQEMWRVFNTRFVTGLSFAVNYKIASLDPFGYHVVNWACHVLAAFLVYLFVMALSRAPGLKNDPHQDDLPFVALSCALIFLVHPLQTQAVNFITQRCVSMATVFILASMIFYMKARIDKRPLFFIGTFMAMLLGLFSKEMTVVIPLALTAFELYWMRQQGTSYKWPKVLIVFYVLSLVVPVTLFFDAPGSILEMKAQIVGRTFSWHYFFTEINVFRTYIRMLLLPLFQSHHYAYPLVEDIFEWPTIFSVLLLGAVIFYAVKQFNRQRLLSFAIVLFYLGLIVEALHVCFVNKGVIYDHWLYFPMVGFSLFASVFIFSCHISRRMKKGILIGVIIFFSMMAFARNRVWHNCIALWQDVVKKYPDDYLPYVNLGVALSAKGYLDNAIGAYERALDLHDNQDTKIIAQIMVNLGAAYGKKGDYEKEVEYNLNAIRQDPSNVQAYSNLCLAYSLLGDNDRALGYGMKALTVDPDHADAYNNLGVLFGQMGDFQKARDYFQAALRLNPDHVQAPGNLQKALGFMQEDTGE